MGEKKCFFIGSTYEVYFKKHRVSWMQSVLNSIHITLVPFLIHPFVKNSASLSFDYWKKKGLSSKDFLQFCGLRNAIMKTKKPSFTEQKNPHLKSADPNTLMQVRCPDGQVIDVKSSFKAKQYYKLLTNCLPISRPLPSNKIKQDFNLTDEELGSLFCLTYKITNDTKLWDLQYRIINFIYNTNYLLKKKKIVDKENCDFCGFHTETLYHLFYDCITVNDFWKNVNIYWNNKSTTEVNLVKKDNIFGNVNYPSILNLIILLGKRYIHYCKINNMHPNHESFTRTLKDYYDLGKTIAEKQWKVRSIQKKMDV